MDSDDKFWLGAWSIVASVIITITVSAATYNIKYAELIANATDPIAVACGINGSRDLNSSCEVLRGRK